MYKITQQKTKMKPKYKSGVKNCTHLMIQQSKGPPLAAITLRGFLSDIISLSQSYGEILAHSVLQHSLCH